MMLPSLRLVFKENMIPQFTEILSDFFMDHAAIQASVNCSGALSLLVSNVKRSFSHTISFQEDKHLFSFYFFFNGNI